MSISGVLRMLFEARVLSALLKISEANGRVDLN